MVWRLLGFLESHLLNLPEGLLFSILCAVVAAGGAAPPVCVGYTPHDTTPHHTALHQRHTATRSVLHI
ncbi:unnamed protein product [Calypogeia fissa]